MEPRPWDPPRRRVRDGLAADPAREPTGQVPRRTRRQLSVRSGRGPCLPFGFYGGGVCLTRADSAPLPTDPPRGADGPARVSFPRRPRARAAAARARRRHGTARDRRRDPLDCGRGRARQVVVNTCNGRASRDGEPAEWERCDEGESWRQVAPFGLGGEGRGSGHQVCWYMYRDPLYCGRSPGARELLCDRS